MSDADKDKKTPNDKPSDDSTAVDETEKPADAKPDATDAKGRASSPFKTMLPAYAFVLGLYLLIWILVATTLMPPVKRELSNRPDVDPAEVDENMPLNGPGMDGYPANFPETDLNIGPQTQPNQGD